MTGCDVHYEVGEEGVHACPALMICEIFMVAFYCERKKISKTPRMNERFQVLRERHTTGEMHFPLLAFTLSSLAEAALRSGSLRAASARSESGPKTESLPA